MKIMLVTRSGYFRHYATPEYGLIRALERSEHRNSTFLFQKLTTNRYMNRVLITFPILKNQHEKAERIRFFNSIKINSPELVLIIKGEWLSSVALSKSKRAFPNTQFACFNPDDPFNELVCNEAIRQSIPWYDHYFIWSRKLIPKIIKAGCPHVHYLPFAVDTGLVYPYKLDQEKKAISFIGNSDEKRNQYIQNIVKFLQKKDRPIPVQVYGRYWEKHKNVIRHPKLVLDQYIKEASSTEINLNILRTQNKDATNMRTFEIPAMNSFLLHEKSEEAQKIFVEDKEMVFFESPEEAADKAIFYLKHEALRKKIAQAGFLKVKKQTYINRLEKILDLIKSS